MIFIVGGESTTQAGVLRSVSVNVAGQYCFEWPDLSVERKNAAALVIPYSPNGLICPFGERGWLYISLAVCGGFTGTDMLRDCVLFREADGRLAYLAHRRQLHFQIDAF